MTWLIFKFTYKSCRAPKIPVIKSLRGAISAAWH
jgi:hypothetical protein